MEYALSAHSGATIEKKLSLETIFWSFLSFYAFFSGFVFIEPSPAEFLFILFFLIFLRKFTLHRSLLLTFLLLFLLPTFVSSYVGGLFFQIFNLRFLGIDIYLFTFYTVAGSLIRKFSSQANAQENLGRVFLFWAFGGLVNIALCFLSYRTSGKLFGVDLIIYGLRMKGFFKDPNVLSPYLIPPAIFILDKVFELKRFSPRFLLYLSGFLTLSVGVLMSFSRAGWLNYIVSLFVYFILKLKNRKIKQTLMVLLLLLISGVLVHFSLSKITIFGYNVIEFLFGRARLQDYDVGRFSAQRKFAEILQSTSVLFGCGPGNYEVFAGMATHSLYMRYLGERGLFGASLFAIFLAVVLRKAFKSAFSEVLFSTIFGQLVNSIFIDSLHWRHLWLLFSIAHFAKIEDSCKDSYKKAFKFRKSRLYFSV